MSPKKKTHQKHGGNREGVSSVAGAKMTRIVASTAALHAGKNVPSVQYGVRPSAHMAAASHAAAVDGQNKGNPKKRLRTEKNNDDVNEDVTPEQLGKQAYQVAPPLPSEFLLSPSKASAATVQAITTTTTSEAAVERCEGGWGGLSLSGASTPSLAKTSVHAEAKSPECLTCRNSNTTPLPSSTQTKNGTRHSLGRSECIPYISDGEKNKDSSDRDSIALSPEERPSTTLIRKAAATRPAVSPATLWICIDEDDDEDEEIKVISCPPLSAPPAVRPEMCTSPPHPVGDATRARGTTAPQQTPQPPRREPIAGVLPPTFRPRKGPLQANKPPPRSCSPLPNGCFIYDDDITEDDEEGNDGEADGHKAAGNLVSQQPYQKFNNLVKHLDMSTTMHMSFSTLPYNTSRSYIIDDDNDDEIGNFSQKEDQNNKTNTSLGELGKNAMQLADRATGVKPLRPLGLPSSPPTNEPTLSASFNSNEGSPARSVRDFLFSSRPQVSTDWCNSSFSSFTFATAATARASPTSITMLGKEELDLEPKRAVEKVRPLFEKRFTRKCFLDTVESVVSKLHCLEPGEFWQAFITAEYVGEGSFGIVWRCQTVDGDLVAVKSCPISFHSRGSIDDGFSVLREIAIMRFLNEHEVPYILPLYSAFFVPAREALPPDVVEAVEWRARLAEAEEERERKKRKKQRKRSTRKGQRKQKPFMQSQLSEEEEGNEKETEDQLAERMRYEKVRIPCFLSISVEDALNCDATIFLVTELCDGDVGNIERHDSITKGVAFCVSSALSAMHQLGLVHLDLKPSNILFAYENSPSQLQYHSQRQQQEPPATPGNAASIPSSLSTPPSSGVMRVANTPTAGSVKFYLSDFGNCRIVGPGAMDEVTGVFGTLEYMDSRALQDKTCSRATDCYSLGATLYELIYSRRLYPPCKNPKCVSEDDHTRHCYIEAAQQPVIAVSPPNSSSSPSTMILQKVIMGLLALDPRERWTAERCRSFFLINSVAGGMNTTPT
ncbi:putative serine/threonine-protein kinase [Trypanosoma cruzi]|uniref:Protein kinase, putative n=2 Tax=Trypanosoma cruzi TaxID=5693 RepID=Q4CZA3_TRYCC|nr:protein kinase, putative [Trypanosoma cruzi]EAN85605.1 protein kinase, putative [Trypanosoma cruzi]PWV05750.1 putative serine/threonine-protein kinase [Trypanosoma cruzi]|eukprot:XP_807456.1 protein kinase [Trypanosoma cruzi strain CL Brener]